MKLFRNISRDDDLFDWAVQVTRERLNDVSKIDQLDTTRSRIWPAPSSSTDITGGEKVGDIAADATYLYYVAKSGGSLVWRRISGSSF